jgi:peptidoglycan/LPS O-acetylase OafA/YrhL
MKLTYRPEIDGLRAIAVGAVILYHAPITILGYKPFKGGFIGVDIFFVISGYLITSIILKELVTTGSFSFKHFYERRVRRILPALLFVMLVSLPFAWMYLLPDNFIDYSKSILYSLGFSSNFYFWYSGQQYGAESGLLIPFLHTWSLSVEEQFYILFPIVLLITFKYFKKYLVHILILGFIISLGLAEWTSRNYPSASFYFLHTRMWELLAGSILAYFEITFGHRSKNRILNLLLPFIGLILIGHSILFFNDEMFHPSFYTLSLIIGVCLIIWFSDKNELITKILSTKLFVGIGLISYSLYLWHYPIFAFIKITGLVMGNVTYKLLLIPILLICSVISYYFVEKPFRNKKNSIKNILILIFISSLILISYNLYVIYNNGVKNRLPEIFQQNLRERNVNFHQKDSTQKIVLIGDSHSEALEFNLNEEIKKKDLSLIRFRTKMYLTNFNNINKKTKKINDFNKNNIKIDNFLKENSNLIIVFHHRWGIRLSELNFLNEEGFKEALHSQINKIITQGHKLILVYPVPELGADPNRYLFRKYILNKNVFNNSIPVFSSSYEVYKKRNKLMFEVLDSIKNENIIRIYPHKLFCDKQIKDRCVANDKNNIFYYDDDHLSLQGSKFVVDEIMKEIEKIEIKSN